MVTGGQGNSVFVYDRNGALTTAIDFGATYFNFNLEGSQEVPANPSTASGVGTAFLAQNQTKLTIQFTVAGLDLDGNQTAPAPDNVTASHIHDGDAGVNGGVVFNILGGAAINPVAGTVSNVWTGINAAGAANLLADGGYVNVHTTGFPGGELRGQILSAGADTDRIDVTALGVGSLSELMPFLSEAGGDTTLATQLNSVTSSLVLSSVSLAGLTDANFIFGGAGAQSLVGTAGVDDLFGGADNDTLNGAGGADTLVGGAGNDRYFVDNVADTVVEAAGGGAADYVFSTVSYTASANTERLYLEGTANIDAIGRDGETDILVGNSGNNTIDGKGGVDLMRGGLGDDFYYVDNAADVVDEVTGGGGATDLIFTTSSYQIAAGAERLIAVEGANAVGLTARNNQNDIVIGNSSTNVFIDQFGRDTYVGGGGADFFRFIANLDPVNNVNRINDFNSVDDQFQLQQLIYTQIDVGILDASEFVLGTAAGDADDRIIYDSNVGKAYYDPDGTGATAQIEIVNVTDGTVITADDFQIF